MTTATKTAEPVGALRKQGYVYIGGYQPHPEVLYIKIGKSNRPKERAKDYGGMVPGGLKFMQAGKVENSTRAEAALLTLVASMEGVEPVGGEWFKCDPFLRLSVLDQLRVVGREIVQVHTYCPNLFGSVTAGKRNKTRRAAK